MCGLFLRFPLSRANVLLGIAVKLVFASLPAECVMIPLIIAGCRSLIRVNLFSTNRIFCHCVYPRYNCWIPPRYQRFPR